MSFSTRPPGGDPGGFTSLTLTTVTPSLKALVDEVRALLPEAVKLPTLPDPGGDSTDAVLLRWLRSASAGGASLPDLKAAVEEANNRVLANLAAGRGAPAVRAGLEPARAALLRALAVAGGAPIATDPQRSAANETAARSPASAPGAAATPQVPVTPPLKALVEALRSLYQSPTPLPPLPEVPGDSAEAAVQRWLRQSFPAGRAPVVELRLLVDEAQARVQGSGNESSALVSARTALLRALSPPPSSASRSPATPDRSSALRTLVETVRTAVSAEIGLSTPLSLPLAAAGEPGNAGAVLLGWLRATAAGAGVPPRSLVAAVETGVARALATLSATGGGTALEDTIAQARDVVLRGLDAAPAARTGAGLHLELTPPPPFLPGLRDPAAARALASEDAGALRRRDRVEAVGDEDRLAREAQSDPEPAPAPDADEPPDTPMQCIRRHVECLQGGDSQRYAENWVYPACTWLDGEWSGYLDAAACIAGTPRLREAGAGSGSDGTKILMLRVEPVSDQVALVHAALADTDAQGRTAREYDVVYTTVRTPAGWRVAVCLGR